MSKDKKMAYDFIVGSLTVSTLEDDTFDVKFNHPDGMIERRKFTNTRGLIAYLKATERNMVKYMRAEQDHDMKEISEPKEQPIDWSDL